MYKLRLGMWSSFNFLLESYRRTWVVTSKSKLHYYHTTYYSCSYVFNSVHEYFAATDSHLQISQHQASWNTKTSQ